MIRGFHILVFGMCLVGVALNVSSRPVAAAPVHDIAPGEYEDALAITDPWLWFLFRAGAVPFPTYMYPVIPETGELGPAIDFGQKGDELTIVIPENLEINLTDRALQVATQHIRRKSTNGKVVRPSELTDDLKKRHLLILGAHGENPVAKQALGADYADFMKGIADGGYHIKPVDSPFAKGRRAIVAEGKDGTGAWRVALMFAHSLHPYREDMGQVVAWDVKVPDSTYWAQYEAKYEERGHIIPPEKLRAAKPPTEWPKIPFGVRCWGSPIPNMDSYQKMMFQLKDLGVDTMVLQMGAWPDTQDPAKVLKTAVDIGWQAGIHTIPYVGNELRAHKPDVLMLADLQIIDALKDHPGVRSWRLYNQVSPNLTKAEFHWIEDQIKYLKRNTDKPIGMEVVWGHNRGDIPEERAKYIAQLRDWGVTELANDYAPIGGWSKDGDLSLWETRIQELVDLDLIPMAVLQAHVPFREPELPSPAQLRNQVWWCVAAGAKGYFFEAAYLMTQYSMRGILGWNLEPLPDDGRAAEVKRLSGVVAKLETMLLTTKKAAIEEVKDLGIELPTEVSDVVPRLRKSDDALYLILINRDVKAPKTETLALTPDSKLVRAVEISPAPRTIDLKAAGALEARLEAGAGVCYRLEYE